MGFPAESLLPEPPRAGLAPGISVVWVRREKGPPQAQVRLWQRGLKLPQEGWAEGARSV